MKPPRLVAISGSVRRPPGTRALIEFVAALSLPTADYASDADFHHGTLKEGVVSEGAASAAR